jgi:hypothetical protein
MSMKIGNFLLNSEPVKNLNISHSEIVKTLFWSEYIYRSGRHKSPSCQQSPRHTMALLGVFDCVVHIPICVGHFSFVS